MARGKSITLKGPAAQAFVESMKGVEPKNEDDALKRIATRVHMEMSAGNMKGAVEVLRVLTQSGAIVTAKALP
jgi:hypothetical protein